MVSQFLLARHEWLATLLADWSPAERCDFARLIGRLADSVDEHVNDLSC